MEVLRDPYPAGLGRRIARKTLLAVASLVSIHDAIWTTDRLGAARRWGVVRPQLAAPLQELVAWSHAGTSEPSQPEVQILLAGVVAEVVDDFRRQIGLWIR